MGGWTVGKYVLAVLVLIVAFPLVMEALKFVCNTITETENTVTSAFPSVHGFASLFDSFIRNLNSWLRTVLLSTLGVAVLVFVSLIYYAFESRWR